MIAKLEVLQQGMKFSARARYFSLVNQINPFYTLAPSFF
jgi:hypothetical protein